MYSSESEQKSLAALADTLKSKGVDQVDDLNDDDLDALEDSVASDDDDEDEDELEEDEDGKKEDGQRSSSGVPIPCHERLTVLLVSL